MNKLILILLIISMAFSIYAYLIATGINVPKIVLDESITDAACYNYVTTCSAGSCTTFVSRAGECKGGLGGAGGDSPVRRR